MEPENQLPDINSETPSENFTPDALAKLAADLDAERKSRKALEDTLKQKTAKEREYEVQLEKYRQIDPKKYEQMLIAERNREEQDLLKRRDYDELKSRLEAAAEASRNETKSWQTRYNTLQLETAVKSAFYDAGGKKTSYSFEDGREEVPPVEAVLNIMRDRIQIQDGKLIVLSRTGQPEFNSQGEPKSLGEKMLELRNGSLGSLFEPNNSAAGGGMTTSITQNGQNYKVFSREQARRGKASIDEIASGKVLVQ